MLNLEEGLEETAIIFGKVLRDMPLEDREISRRKLESLLRGFWSSGDNPREGLFEKDIRIIASLLTAYREGDQSAITETVTGGCLYSMDREKELIGFNPRDIFHNETIVNHLSQVKRDYIRFKGFFRYTHSTPFFERLEGLADEYTEAAIQIKSGIFSDPEFRNCYDAYPPPDTGVIAYLLAVASGIRGYEMTKIVTGGHFGSGGRGNVTSREEVRSKYLEGEFKRKDQVVGLLAKLDSFYRVASLFVEKILENQPSH